MFKESLKSTLANVKDVMFVLVKNGKRN